MTEATEGAEHSGQHELTDVAQLLRAIGECDNQTVVMARRAEDLRAATIKGQVELGRLVDRAGALIVALNGHKDRVRQAIVDRLVAGEEHGPLFVLAALAADRSDNVRPSRVEAVQGEAERLLSIALGTPLIVTSRRLTRPQAYTAAGTVRLDSAASGFSIPAVSPEPGSAAQEITVGGTLTPLIANGDGPEYRQAHGIYFGDRIAPAVAEAVANNINAGADWVVALSRHGLTLESVGVSPMIVDIIKNNVATRISSFLYTDPHERAAVEAACILDDSQLTAALEESMLRLIAEGLRTFTVEYPTSALASGGGDSQLREKVRTVLAVLHGVEPASSVIDLLVQEVRRQASAE